MRWGVAGLAIAAVLLVACSQDGGGDGTAEPSPQNTPAVAAEEALRLFVERRLNQAFVADCDDVERPADVGKQCAHLRGEREGLLAYELGPAFGEYTRLIILQRAGDSWTIAYQETRDLELPRLPGIPWPLEVGATVVVAGTGDCLAVRQEPGLASVTIDCLDDGVAVTISAGPTDRDGLQWWRLQGHGWSAGTYLRYEEEAGED